MLNGVSQVLNFLLNMGLGRYLEHGCRAHGNRLATQVGAAARTATCRPLLTLYQVVQKNI